MAHASPPRGAGPVLTPKVKNITSHPSGSRNSFLFVAVINSSSETSLSLLASTYGQNKNMITSEPSLK